VRFWRGGFRSRAGHRVALRAKLWAGRFWVLALVSCWIFMTLTPVLAVPSPLFPCPRQQAQAQPALAAANQPSLAQSAEDSLTLGKQRYDAGLLSEALEAWSQAATQFARQHQPLAQAAALRYLAIAHQDLGDLSAAEIFSNQAWAIVQSQPRTLLFAQVLNTQGTIQLSQGKARNAHATFRQAEVSYQALGDRSGMTLSQLNQIQALQSLGFYRRAEAKLLNLRQSLGLYPEVAKTTLGRLETPTQLQAEILLSLAQVWESMGNLPEAETALDQSAAFFESLGAQEQLATVFLLHGDIARSQQQLAQAETFYSKALSQADLAIAKSNSTDTNAIQLIATQAQLRQLRLLIQTQDWSTARRLGYLLLSQLDPPPLNHRQIEVRINLAESLRLMEDFAAASRLLDSASLQAETLADFRALSYILGQQGQIYEAQGRWAEALDVTRQARRQSAALGADEITVHWFWQEGRILKQQGDQNAAITAYREAIGLLQTLRQDLVAMNSEVRFSFRDQVEPVYRQLVELLLMEVDALPADLKQQRLEQARQAIEALQLAQVQNFLQEACETYDVRPIDQIDSQAAVFYPIVLGDRLEVVLALPGLLLQHYGSSLSQAAQQQQFAQLRQSLNLAFPIRDGLSAAQQFYDQLIRPAETWLTQQHIQTLVFVLDDFLRDIPMAVLHDGDRYLVQKYSLALTPGLQLFDSKPLAESRLQVLAAGLSQARQGFSALPGVEQELQGIAQRRQARLNAEVLLDQDFTKNRLIRQAEARPFNVLHFATHGQFSSKARETFLLTWDDRLGMEALDQWLNPMSDRSNAEPRSPIELLILSACQTARGDRRATLGLAGLAVRSGARSTLATLWSVQDQSTAQLIDTFYGQLTQQGGSRAEALRQAQLALLESDYAHPYYWAPFVLVGNWR